MNNTRLHSRSHWQDWCTLVLGLWLLASPGLLRFGGHIITSPTDMTAPAWNAWVLGILVFLASLSALLREDISTGWVIAALGVWILIAPWVLGFSSTFPNATRDHWIVGAVIAILGFLNASSGSGRRPNIRA